MLHHIEVTPWGLEGDLVVPPGAAGLALFVHGSGSSRFSPRNRLVAQRLNEAGLATLLMDLLTPEEDRREDARFDIPLLSERVQEATRFVARNSPAAGLPVGYFGASTGAAAALVAASDPASQVFAVVSRGGRPDLANGVLPQVHVPTLLIVGSRDTTVLRLNRGALQRLGGPAALEIVPGATHLFEEPGALESVASLAASWLQSHLPAVPGAHPVAAIGGELPTGHAGSGS